MKLAIPVDENKLESSVCMSFGRTPYYLIFDEDSKEVNFIDNSAIASSGGAGIKAAQIIVDNKVDVMLTPRLGQNAADVLNAGEIKIYKTIEGNAVDNIEAFDKGELSILKEIHAGFHGHGVK